MIHEYLFLQMWIFWLLVFFSLLILEIVLGSFFLVCMALGSFVSLLASVLGMPLYGQFLLFIAVSILSIYGVRPFLVAYLHRPHQQRASNIEALIGKQGVVVDSIEPPAYGYVKVDGDEWRAVSLNETAIALGRRVEIVKMDSLIAIVKEI